MKKKMKKGTKIIEKRRMRLRRNKREINVRNNERGERDFKNELQGERECKKGVKVKPKPNCNRSCMCQVMSKSLIWIFIRRII